MKTALMSGATSGFGKIITKHLVKKGYRLIYFARSAKLAETLKASLEIEHPAAEIEYLICDLSSFHSIKSACKTLRERNISIDTLILNAGIWNFEFKETVDGFEEILQVNLLAPLLILSELKSLIPQNGCSKVIFTSSGLHQGKISYDNLEFRNDFSGFKAYRQSKLGIILLTRFLAKQPEFSGISILAVHPGMVRTNLGKNAGWLSRQIFYLLGKSPEKGARTHIYLIDQQAEKLVSGEYYADCKISASTKEAADMNEAERLHKLLMEYLKPFIS
jgi:NAD(P)-dependent dehydrogenase (short-subunit alcohol dehydrogenase family)